MAGSGRYTMTHVTIAPEERNLLMLERNHCADCDGTATTGPAVVGAPCPRCGKPTWIRWVVNDLFEMREESHEPVLQVSA